ncbi:MAG: hypothetical protein K6G36_02150 [Candidatus Saccharibacteria bacterium]|nr:hypothetical protein [Candidatus Saccharibacteria bacterium]
MKNTTAVKKLLSLEEDLASTTTCRARRRIKSELRGIKNLLRDNGCFSASIERMRQLAFVADNMKSVEKYLEANENHMKGDDAKENRKFKTKLRQNGLPMDKPKLLRDLLSLVKLGKNYREAAS